MASCTAPNNYLLPAGGSYFLGRGICAGIGTSFKITPQASSPMNKGPPAFATWRSVNRRLSLTLVRTQHPPPENSQLLLGKVSRSRHRPTSQQNGLQNGRVGSRVASPAVLLPQKYPG